MNALTFLRPDTATALPDASAWHQTSKARAMVKAMHDLSKVYDELVTADGEDEQTIAWKIGQLEPDYRGGFFIGYQCYGIVGMLHGELTQLRDYALSDALTAAERANGWDDTSDHSWQHNELLEAHLDTVDAAISRRCA